jgi:hypothetical protein
MLCIHVNQRPDVLVIGLMKIIAFWDEMSCSLWIIAFWDEMSCSLVAIYQHFTGTYYFNLQGGRDS